MIWLNALKWIIVGEVPAARFYNTFSRQLASARLAQWCKLNRWLRMMVCKWDQVISGASYGIHGRGGCQSNQWHVDSHPWLGQVTPAAKIGNWWAKEAGPPQEVRPDWLRLAPLLQPSTNDMGCFGSGGGDGDVNGKRERRRRHREIQKQIQQDKQIYRATHRLLLLGNNLHLSSAHRPYWITVFSFSVFS